MTLARDGRWKKRNETNQRTKKINTNLNRSTAQLIHGGIEDLWEEFILCKENEKEKMAEASQREVIAKKGAEKIRQFALGKLRKRDAKGSQKDKEVEVDCHLQTQKTPVNHSSSPIPSLSSNNDMDFVNQHVA